MSFFSPSSYSSPETKPQCPQVLIHLVTIVSAAVISLPPCSNKRMNPRSCALQNNVQLYNLTFKIP